MRKTGIYQKESVRWVRGVELLYNHYTYPKAGQPTNENNYDYRGSPHGARTTNGTLKKPKKKSKDTWRQVKTKI